VLCFNLFFGGILQALKDLYGKLYMIVATLNLQFLVTEYTGFSNVHKLDSSLRVIV